MQWGWLWRQSVLFSSRLGVETSCSKMKKKNGTPVSIYIIHIKHLFIKSQTGCEERMSGKYKFDCVLSWGNNVCDRSVAQKPNEPLAPSEEKREAGCVEMTAAFCWLSFRVARTRQRELQD